jgi:ABC-type nitrate/sulfonate/bicarbonate transport system permease component
MASDTLATPARRLNRRFVAEGFVVVALLGWWLTARNMPPSIFPSPSSVLVQLADYAVDPGFWANAGMTGLRIFLAVVLATFIGTVIGLLPRYVRWTAGIVDDILVPFFTSFPAIVWAILGTVWFGVTPQTIVFIQVLIILPLCLVNVAEGAKSVGDEEIEMGLSFGRSRLAIFWLIELRLLSPFIMAGARLAYGICWKTSLIAELFGARSGLGYMLQVGQDMGQVDSVVAICLAIVIFVIIGEWLIMRPLARLFDTGNMAGREAAGPRRPVAPTGDGEEVESGPELRLAEGAVRPGRRAEAR